MFRHHCVVLGELVVSTLPSYTSMSNAVVGNTITYQQLRLTYLCNLASYWLQAHRGWHRGVETCRSVIICEIMVHLFVTVQYNKRCTVRTGIKIRKYQMTVANALLRHHLKDVCLNCIYNTLPTWRTDRAHYNAHLANDIQANDGCLL
jgi:hypothetical protein